MKMDKTILLQKQVRDNSEDLRSYLTDLGQWEEDMKRKESDISGGSGDSEVPVPRNKSKKLEELKSRNKSTKKETPKPQKIKSYDYAAWDKFDVDAECEKLDKIQEPPEESSDSEDEPSEEYKAQLREEANYEKERGNQFVKNKKWGEAIACYTHSIACYSKDPIYFANRALCFLKQNNLHSAEADCTSALQLDSTYVKALQRRATAREGLKQLKEAAEDLQKVLDIEPHNKESKIQLEKIEKRLGIVKQKPVDCSKPSTSKSQENLTAIIPKPVVVKNKTTASLSKSQENLSPIIPKPLVVENKTKEAETKQKSTIPKQIPWPDRPSAELILPTHKLPHKRSKKPLRRVEIIETNSSEIQLTKKLEPKIEKITDKSTLNVDYNESDALAQILAQSNQLDVDEILNNFEKDVIKSETKAAVQTNDKLASHAKTNETSAAKTNETASAAKTNEPIKVEESTAILKFPIPKSSVQFYSNWKTMKNSNNSKYLYLKQINPKEIPNIFKDSMESDALSDIIFILSEYFVENKLPIYEYLNYLSNIKRFSTLTMFMTTKDKIALQKIFEHCEDSNEFTEEELNILRKKYEL